MRSMVRGGRATLLVALTAVLVGLPSAGNARVQHATVEGPIPDDAGIRGHALWDSWFDLSGIGYREDEYFVSGTARHDNGTDEAPYTTRIIVTRPIDPARFNGSILLDWVNVTAQFENAVELLEARELLVREGWAFVHVSAQAAGICCTPLTPKVWDPVRYAPLDHPGDAYANSIFSQVAKAIREPKGTDPTDGLRVRRVIAAGQSQSASRLYSYVTTEQPRAGVIDAFLIHGGGSKTYARPPRVPVLHLLSEREGSPEEPNQTDNYRLWEIAGSAHSDMWIGYSQVAGQGPRFAGGPTQPASAAAELDEVAGNYGEQLHPLHAACTVAGATFPTRYSVNAALHHLERWVATGHPPPDGPRYEFDSSGQLARDADGNGLGGIRLPPVDVPVARYGTTVCNLGGVTIPFTEIELLQRYPTHADYMAQMAARTADSVAAGFLLPDDAADLLRRACNMHNRWPLDNSAGQCVTDSPPVR